MERTYTFDIRVFDEGAGNGLPGLRVEFWDAEGGIQHPLISEITNADGQVLRTYTDSFFQAIFGGPPHPMYFKVFNGNEMLADTNGWLMWDPGMETFHADIPVPWNGDQTYMAELRVVSEQDGNGIPDLQVEVWDFEHLRDTAVITGTTDDEGWCRLVLTQALLDEMFGGRVPPLYFKVFQGATLLHTTEGDLMWHIEEGNFTGEVHIPWDGGQMYNLTLTVIDEDDGTVLPGMRVEIWDSEHQLDYAIYADTTNDNGTISASFDTAFFESQFGGEWPSLFFMVFNDDTLLRSTEGEIVWTVQDGDFDGQVPVPYERTFTANIIVVDEEDGTGVGNVSVEFWDTAGVATQALATRTTASNGTCQATFTDTFFLAQVGTPTPQLYFKVFRNDTLLTNTEDSIVWETGNDNFDGEIPVPKSNPSPHTGGQRGCGPVNVTTYNVTGSVISTDRAGLGGLTVRVYDKGVGPDYLLRETTTDDCGKFSASFASSLVTERGKTRPDLQAKVFAGSQLIASSEVRYNAFGNETLDIDLPPNSTLLLSEHDALADAVSNHYAGALSNLREDDTQQDISYLANKSGWDARAVALAATADKLQKATEAAGAQYRVDAVFFYALLRSGIPSNENTLFNTDEEMLENIWTAAAEQGVIPASRVSEIPAVLGKFRQLSAQKLLSAPALVGPSSMNTLLGASGLSAGQKSQFASLYAQYRSDEPALWQAVGSTLGEATSTRLQVDGKLAFMTINNAPLMTAVRAAAGGAALTNLVRLADDGFHTAARWGQLLTGDTPIPTEIPGETTEEKRTNYADYLAAQVRLSYPTAVMANLVNAGDLPVTDRQNVHSFLFQHRENFQIGVVPVERYIADNELAVAPAIVTEVKRLQRVYQITQTDEEMAGLLTNNLDAATHVAAYDKEGFIETFGEELGGTEAAEKIHERAIHIHNAVLNVAISYLTARNGISLGSPNLDPGEDGLGQILSPAPLGNGSVDLSQPHGMRMMGKPVGAGDVLAYTTLENLFGEMDFCTCDHCRSILSPAAYLVDLLYFIDKKTPPAPINPLLVLLGRRPDIQHLPLTCENTNTAMPYIDVVNETLEYFITNSLNLTGYLGHDTGTMKSEDLLASPQFVIDTAYTTLAGERFPAPLPFHRPLEGVRRHLEKFETTLPLAMEQLRPHNNLERAATPYGWRDILMEELRISRGEYELLTDSTAVPLWRLYGFPPATTDATVIAGLSNAKKFCRRMDLSYEELVALLGMRFINPSSDIIPKIERLGVTFKNMKDLKAGLITDAAFLALLPTGAGAPNPAAYGGSITNWVKDNTNYARIMSLILLTDTTTNFDACSFDTLELRFSNPMTSPADTSTRLTAPEYTRIARFIRIWKKLGWTMEQTDEALCALFRSNMAQIVSTDVDTVAELNAGFLTLLPRLGVLVRVMRELNLTPERDLLPLLACYSDMGTRGATGLYRQLFLSPTILNQDPVYADNGYGDFLTSGSEFVINHVESLRAALNLTADEFDRIYTALGFTGSTVLNVANVSAMFRRGYLARAMRISVRELLLLTSLTGFNPYALPDPLFTMPNPDPPAILQLIGLVRELKDRSLSTAAALYLVWNQDLSGTSGPTTAQVNEFARGLREDFDKIERDFTIVEDPTGDIARARMTLVYGTEATDFFFGLLNDTYITEVSYSHFTSAFGPALVTALTGAAGTYGTPPTLRIAYDDFRKRLTFTGVLNTTKRNNILTAIATAPVVTEAGGSFAAFQTAFTAATNALHTANSAVVNPFFARYAELLPLYTTFIGSGDPPEVKRSTLLASFLPALIERRKVQQTLQRLADAAQTDRAFAETVVYASPAGSGLHKAGAPTLPALNDLLAMETEGLSAQFHQGNTIAAAVFSTTIEDDLIYAAATSNTLPPNPLNPANPISCRFTGSWEAPETAFYNIYIEAEALSTVTLKVDGVTVPLTQVGTVWNNTTAMTLKGGTLYTVELTVERVKDTLRVQWETPGKGRTPIPARRLYPSSLFSVARDAYFRFLKGSALAEGLKLTAAEVVRPVMSGVSWLNSIPVVGNAVSPATFVAPLRELLDFAYLKAALSPESDRLLTVMRDPVTATATPDSLLYTLTSWDVASHIALNTRFSITNSTLSQPAWFRRVYDAFVLLRGMGISAASMIAATTNDPTATILRNLQAALRARYSIEDWRQIVQPINDAMRGLQRDALVAYILHKFRSNVATEHINTTEKLFEYFLMDVAMEPCMQTSRIRHALSSVQLFIERCLMNLEANIPSSLVNSTQWEWMKRYRMWEANRKVFLFPENWLEPELRDDKSPFFKDLESELLQSDITEDSAATAMLEYLTSLEEVAKLEPCGFFYIEPSTSGIEGDVNHVIARTAGAHRKYYYRRREYGYWTPWEQIKVDIEDNPVTPVVWRDRLFLFWVKVLQKGPNSAAAQKPTGTNAGDDLANLNLPPDPLVKVEVVLCWSEFYNGKWQAAKTSDLEHPAHFNYVAPNTFDRSTMWFYFNETADGLQVNVNGYGSAGFLLYNTHSTPAQGADAYAVATLPLPSNKIRWSLISPTSLGFMYYRSGVSGTLTRSVLKPLIPYNLVLPWHRLNNWWVAPFFYQDKRHVFYVRSEAKEIPIWLHTGYGYPTTRSTGTTSFAPLTGAPAVSYSARAAMWAMPAGESESIAVTGVGTAQRFVTEDAHITHAIGSTGLVEYGAAKIGPAGSI